MKLKELRTQKKISQIQLAEELKLNVMTYNNWEKGKREPSIETLIKLADFYNVTLDYLVGRNFGNELGYLTNEQLETIKMFLALPLQQQLRIQGRIMECYENL